MLSRGRAREFGQGKGRCERARVYLCGGRGGVGSAYARCPRRRRMLLHGSVMAVCCEYERIRLS